MEGQSKAVEERRARRERRELRRGRHRSHRREGHDADGGPVAHAERVALPIQRQRRQDGPRDGRERRHPERPLG